MHTQLLIRHIDQLEFSTIGLFLFEGMMFV